MPAAKKMGSSVDIPCRIIAPRSQRVEWLDAWGSLPTIGPSPPLATLATSTLQGLTVAGVLQEGLSVERGTNRANVGTPRTFPTVTQCPETANTSLSVTARPPASST